MNDEKSITYSEIEVELEECELKLAEARQHFSQGDEAEFILLASSICRSLSGAIEDVMILANSSEDEEDEEDDECDDEEYIGPSPPVTEE